MSVKATVDETQKYTRIAMLLHWLTVVLVVASFTLGWSMVDLPTGPRRGELFALHKAIGISVFLLTAWRLGWRLTHRAPPLSSALPAWQRSLVKTVHWLFYALLFTQPLLGYLSSAFSAYPTHYLGLTLPTWATPNPALNELFSELHAAGAVGLLATIAAHLLGVLSHLARRGDRLVRRMLPWS
ncbi:MAG: cytochrome b [Gammaproteobacteria bacterium]|nr:cytochrome b [Gammaproteobacteria bacterium]